MADYLLERITIAGSIVHGKPVVRGLRYPVETLLELLSSGMTIEEILARALLRVIYPLLRTGEPYDPALLNPSSPATTG